MNTKGMEKYQWSLEQLGQFRAQMIAYRILSRNEMVPIDLMELCNGKFKPVSHVTQPSPVPPKPWPTLQEVQNARSKDMSLATVQVPLVRSTTTSNISQQKPGNLTSTVVPVQNSNISYQNTTSQCLPKHNPVKTLQERENRITNQIALRIQELNNLPANMPLDMRSKAQAELKKLQLLNLQREIKKQVLQGIKKDSTLENSAHLIVYKKCKFLPLRTAQSVEKFCPGLNLRIHPKSYLLYQGIFSAVLQNGRYLREMSSKNFAKVAKINKAILVYHANLEKERRKERERIEKERMKRLMEEDEEGYRILIDQKKDRRLAFLLAQTDEYISRLSDMVKQHKMGVKMQLSGKKKGPKALNSTGDSVAGKETAMSEINIDEAKKLINDAKFEDDEYKTTENINSYYSIAHSVTEVVTEQATILVNGKLKEYQIKGLEWLVSLYNNNLNGILADDMGLGKTIQTIALITYLMEKKNVTGPYLIIVPLSTLSNWLLEFKTWAPTVNVLAYKGSIEERYQTQSEMVSAMFNVLITTFELITRDRTVLSKVCWKYMIIDEGHRMKNHHCKLTLTLNKYYKASHRLLLTGTPLQNKLPELWSLLNFLLPSIFKSCATFEDWFNAPFAITGAKVELNEEETILIIRRLHKVLRPFLLRRLKKEVESQLPGKVEHVIKCNMSSLQRILYRNMQSKGYIQTGSTSESGGVRAMMNSLMQLRKICNHPFLFHQVEEEYYNHVNSGSFVSGPELYRVAGKFELLDRILPKLKATNHRVLLFCQMTKLMNIMEDYLKWRDFKYLRLDGTTKANTRGELLSNFNSPESNVFLFLLSTRAGGLGLNLQSADTVILFDSDWNPHQDLQAQDRAHRIGQQHKVLVIRLLILNSVEERILAAAKYKLNIDEKVIQAGMFNQKSTGSERQEFLKSILHQDGEDEDEEEVPNDDSINKMIARSPEELGIFHKMDIERKDLESNSGYKPRLLEESELPKSITKVEMLNDEEQQENPEDSKGLRKRRKVMYRDTITDDEWFEAVGDFDDEWDSENLKQNTPRKRGRPRKTSVTTVYQNESDDSSAKNSRKTTRKPRKTDTMQKKLINLMDKVIKYTSEDGRVPSDAFMKLPLKKEMPDYYKTIKEPMDIKKINLKITSGKINSLDHLESYFMLMCKNAQTFYDASSVIHADAIRIQKIFGDLKNKLETGNNSGADCENRDQPLKIKIKIKKRRRSN